MKTWRGFPNSNFARWVGAKRRSWSKWRGKTGNDSIVQPGCTKPRNYRRRDLKEGKRHLTGKETGPWEIIYFKLYKSQLPVVEKALETAGLMLGTDKSRGYCLEMICADFLAGAKLEDPCPSASS